MGDTRLIFLEIQTYLRKYANDDNFLQHTIAALISRKIEEYWMIMDSALAVLTILDS